MHPIVQVITNYAAYRTINTNAYYYDYYDAIMYYYYYAAIGVASRYTYTLYYAYRDIVVHVTCHHSLSHAPYLDVSYPVLHSHRISL